MGCREFFDANTDNKQKCKLLHDQSEADLISWESESASALSPGVVLDQEVVYQQIVDPTHLSKDGKALVPMSFDVCNSHGLSTHRLAHCSKEKMIALGQERADSYNALYTTAPQKTLWGFAPFLVSDVRKIISEWTGTRGFFVFDTATAGDESHAEICQGARDKKRARSVRMSLYDMAKDALIPLASFKD